MSDTNSRQLAMFRVEADALRNIPSKVAEIFAILKLVPVRAEMIFDRDAIEYIAISEQFAEVPFGMQPPEVTLLVTTDESGRVTAAKASYVGQPPRPIEASNE